MSHLAGAGPSDPRSIQQLVQDAVTDARTIADHERALAQVEVKKSAVRGGVAAGLAVGALTLLFFSAFALMIAVAEGLVAAGLARWGAYLIVFGIHVVLAAALVGVAVLLARRVGPPRKAIALGQETADQVSERLRRLGRPRRDAAGPAQPTEQPPTSTSGASPAPAGSTAVNAS